ncbi:hypothetical protein H2198_007092 [Neophaeococcomyces mojaviensis]|uniref:Uncharacterized protein n=1 Tax=Neophaeococcomyces mojaviensis TaxID=3383035 RepID=A0ACC3A158_9EURO|nr:hypothetical protein H2198_007092 [Knufia sp. JES_112]
MTPESLKWSAQLHLAPPSRTKRLQGDKITLPQSALEGLLAAAPVVSVQNGTNRHYTSNFDPFNQYSLVAERHARDVFADRQQQLPHPLTFRLVNPKNGRAVYAGIREFSAEEGEIGLSELLREALGLQANSTQSTRESTSAKDVDMEDADTPKAPTITIHAGTIPKGTYVKLRPLEAGYDPEDWKSLLERHLRENFTTLTSGEILVVPGARNEKFSFLVDQFEPEGEAICVVDTDLEVDIEAMNEEQARETLQRKLDKAKRAPGTAEGSSTGGAIFLDQEVHGQLLPGEYIDFELKQWDRKQDIEIRTNTDDDAVDVFVTPFSSHLRAKPRLEEHAFADFSDRPAKRLKLSHTNFDLEEAEHINIAVYAWKPENEPAAGKPIPFSLAVSYTTPNVEDATNDIRPASDEVVCKNCKQHIPKRTLPLHEAFCYRNNVSCPKCNNVYLKNSDAWRTHWHCSHDTAYGSGERSLQKHDSLLHPTSTLRCSSCDFEAYNIEVLARHRVADCPSKEILCQFCHLLVPQRGPDDPEFTDVEVLMSSLTPHEYADGARTTECHICSRIVRLRDMRTHLRLHDRERIGKPTPKLCANTICGRTIKAAEEVRVRKEQLGLCNDCFGPLYITTFDPEGKMLRRRIERRLLQQLMSGCGKSWCGNADWCKTGHVNSTGEDKVVSAKEALPRVRPVLDELAQGEIGGIRFCVDEAVQTRRATAEMLAAEGVYELPWCVKALEESGNNLSAAQSWLSDRAPKINEVLT